MLRFIQLIICNLSRIYMIPKMSYMSKHPEKYTEEECYAYARLAVNRMVKSGHIKTEGFGMENLPKEGGYYHNHNEVCDFKPGCFKSAMRAKVPIVPVVLIDSYKVFEEWSIRKVKTQVHYLPAISYEEYKDKNSKQAANMVHDIIKEYINKIVVK